MTNLDKYNHYIRNNVTEEMDNDQFWSGIMQLFSCSRLVAQNLWLLSGSLICSPETFDIILSRKDDEKYQIELDFEEVPFEFPIDIRELY